MFMTSTNGRPGGRAQDLGRLEGEKWVQDAEKQDSDYLAWLREYAHVE